VRAPVGGALVCGLAALVLAGWGARANPPASPDAALARILPAALERGAGCLVRIQGPTGRVRSGVAISASTVVTCLSTLDALGPDELSVHIGERRLPARLAGRDLRLRVVALEVEGAEPGSPLEPARPAAPGRLCLALGACFGEPTATFGMVSAVDRFQGRAYQVDAYVDAANYGGPCLDVEGKLLGLVVHVDDRLGERSGVAFAIPIQRVLAILPRLQAGEVLEPAWLGGRVPRLGGGEGVTLRSVAAGGPLARAGLEARDVIVSLGGRPTPTRQAFRDAQLDLVAGQRVELEFLRGGLRRKVVVTCARKPH